MVKISIDGKEYLVEEGLTIIQVCEDVGIEIPRFCYHEKLAIAGNCRMCLVEVEKSPKPVASCSINITEGMVIKTHSEIVKKAREGVMEFLLINHPLDCPICDQGGECDLQDQAMRYGRCKGDYHEEKRAVRDKYMGPLISTNMTRCIHCTRCVRFLEDIAGTNELGAIGRGENMEVTTYIEQAITSELSGNIIDLCPVGALTSKPYAFTARSWELYHTYSIDISDAVGSHIRIDTRGNEVMRILPQACESINEEWLSDRARFAYDGLKYQRLDTAMLRDKKSLHKISYNKAIELLVETIKGHNVAIIAGKLTDLETMFAAKTLLQKLGNGYTDYECQMHGLVSEVRSDYIFNSQITNIEDTDHCLLINTNPRYEAAIINARIRKTVVHNNLQIAFLGPKANLNYPYNYLGDDTIQILQEIFAGNHPYCMALKSAKKPIMILGSAMFEHESSHIVHKLCKEIARKYGFIDHFNILHYSAGAVGALDIGFVNHKITQNTDYQTVILLGADDIDLTPYSNCKIIYIGHHGDKSVYKADIIIPSPVYTEKSGTYINTEGRMQMTTQATKPLGDATCEYKIFLDIATKLGLNLGFTDIITLRNKISKVSNKIQHRQSANYDFQSDFIPPLPFKYPVTNFYLTDAVTRQSRTMVECDRVINQQLVV